MSVRHPIIAITGSSGAGTTTVTTTFQQIFRREGVRAAIVYGDAFHRYDRDEMRVQRAKAQNNGEMHFSRFGPEANLFKELETLFRPFSARDVLSPDESMLIIRFKNPRASTSPIFCRCCRTLSCRGQTPVFAVFVSSQPSLDKWRPV